MTTNTATADGRTWTYASGLGVGFFALAAATIAAYAQPATGYELSIYHATPEPFWVGVTVALLVALAVGVHARTSWLRSTALLLGGAAIFSIAALPVIRGYHFYGEGDSLTHWGWVRFLSEGDIKFFELLYPGVHSIAAFTSWVAGVDFPRAIMLVVLAFALVFLLFVPLAAATVGSRTTLVLGALVAFLFLPINDVSVFLMAHPSTQAIMFFPVVLYLILRFVTGDPDRPVLRSSFGLLLAATLVAFVLVHPQQAANVLVLVGSMVAVQVWYRRFRPEHPISRHRPLYAHATILAVVFALWTPRHPMAGGMVSTLVDRLLVGGLNVGAETAQRGTSLSAIGGSIEELFVKLFFVSALFCALAGGLMLVNLLGWLDDTPQASAAVTYFTVALVPLFGLFAVLFVTGYETIHFRLIGFIMVIVSVLGAIAIERGLGFLGERASGGAARGVVAVSFALLLVASVPVMFASPYIYQYGHHVTERQVEGHATAFDNRAEDVRFTGIRSPGIRYGDALLEYDHRSRFARPESNVGPAYASQPVYATMEETDRFSARTVQGTFDEPHYLPVTATDRQREVVAFRGIRFDRAGFDSLETTPGVHRVQSNGEFDLYLIE